MRKKKIFGSLLVMALALFAVSSVFVSCKDYDDDINANTASVEALKSSLESVKSGLESELNSTKSSLETQLASAQSALQSAIAAKADAATVSALQTTVSSLQADLAAVDSKLGAQISAANTAIENAQKDATSALTTLAALTGDLGDLKKALGEEEAARKAVAANLEIQEKALAAFKEQVGKDNEALTKRIEELEGAIKNFATDATVSELQGKVKTLSESLTAVNENIDALTVLIERALSSIALVPSLYVDGIETIEFQSIAYYPMTQGGATGLVKASNTEIRIDNGLTEATYRLNPTTVQRDGIDESGIEFKAAMAETRAANIIANSPVQFNGVKSFENGLMTVYVKKSADFTGSLNGSNGKIYIVSLKVPRNAAKYEAADVYSENSRLSEATITPKIAVLPWNNHSVADVSGSYKNHYSDSVTIYGSRVDQTPDMVAKQIYYKDVTNLLELVTGCYTQNNAHNQITKEDLKKYGLTFRFAVAKKAYTNAADNNTDQQTFAKVTPEGILTSTYTNAPADAAPNEACVGKEPIIRVSLVDSVNNKLVDQRYMKIKWTLTEKPAVELDGLKDSKATLSCENVKAQITWDEFISEVYAKARVEGISQAKFETIYPASGRTMEAKGWTTNWSPSTDTSSPATGTFTALPQIGSTTNENGDALIGTWTLSPDDILTVYCNSANDTKTFTAKVTFKSSMPSEYPDLWFNWTFTINLPKLPSINGYYEQYWLDGKVGAEHDVLPVQYNTPAQTRAYCVYDNNLMNAFTYEMNSGIRQFIVKDMPTCGTWDLQFAYNQLSGYKPNYTAPGVEAWKSAGQWCNYVPDAYADFEAYKLMNAGNKALQLVWDDGHSSWCGNAAHKTCNLFADHKTAANQGLLNELASTDIQGTDGTVTPERTHTKPINMTVWATLNEYNRIPVLNYKMYLVAPLRINTAESLGKFQDGVASGDVLNWKESFTLTDFRGYLVADVADNTYTEEQKKYTKSLWTYYEIGDVTINEAQIKYTFSKVNGSLVPNTALAYSQSMTAREISDETNGNIALSMTTVGNNLVFKNNGGSNIEANVKAYIPVQVKYGFGTLTAIVTVDIVPHGHK